MADGPSGATVIETLSVLALGQLGAASGSVKDSAGADIKCDVRIPFLVGTTTYYIPGYDTAV
jgi:hypothetical protein